VSAYLKLKLFKQRISYNVVRKSIYISVTYNLSNLNIFFTSCLDLLYCTYIVYAYI